MAAYGEGVYGEGVYGEGGAGSGPVSAEIGQAVETTRALPLAVLVRVPIGQAVETVEAVSVEAYKEPNPFGAPTTIVGTEGALVFDMSDGTVEAGEPNPNGATKTYWYSWTAPDDQEGLQRFHTRGSNVDTALAVFTGDTFETLVEVAVSNDDSGDDADLRFVPEPGQQYRIQVGALTDPATDVHLTWLSGEPQTYDTFATPLVLETSYGMESFTTTNGTLETGEPVPGGVTATSWLSWTAPDDQVVTFRVRGFDAEMFTVTAYTGLDVTALTVVDTATGSGSVQVTWTPVADQEYRLQVGAVDDLHDYEVDWLVEPVPVEPASLPSPPPPDDYPAAAPAPLPRVYVRAEVYERDGVTLISEVPRRVGLRWREALNEPGVGEMGIPIGDEVLSAYPDLLRYGNVVKFWLGDTCVHGFRIRRRSTRLIEAAEYTARVKVVSGPSVQHDLAAFHVRHDGDPRPDSLDVRYYSWASKKGEWYDDADWQETVHSNTLDDPPSNKKKHKPKNWKVRTAKWIWHPGAHKYFRRTYSVKKNGTLVRIFATADEWWRLYIDGEEVMSDENVEVGYTKYKKYDTVLSKGPHVFAAHVRGVKSANIGDGNDSFLFAMCELDLDGKIIKPALLVSDESWKCHTGNPPPGWNRAQVLRNVVKEARDRGVEAAKRLTFGFDGVVDSDGKTWPTDQFNQDVGIGTSGLDLQAQLSEGNGFDVWVDPADLTLHAYRRRGKDRSASVTLEPGRNLIDWTVDEEDEVENSFLVQYDGGWTTYEAKGSQEDYEVRESFVSVGNVKDDQAAKRLVKRAAQGIASAQDRAGTGEIWKKPLGQPEGGLIGVDGAYPFLDFGVGDTVKAPNADARLVPTRVLALAATEDEDGNLSFDPDVEEIRSV